MSTINHCRGLCERKDFIKEHNISKALSQRYKRKDDGIENITRKYLHGYKRCHHCSIFYQGVGTYCPCCNFKCRTTRRFNITKAKAIAEYRKFNYSDIEIVKGSIKCDIKNNIDKWRRLLEC